MLDAQPLFNLCCPQRRVLELFAGLGGLACAWPEAEIAAAIDINSIAARVYRQNFSHDYLIQEIESLTDAVLENFRADFWWLSPPCQPFSRRGQSSHRPRDIDDPRCGGLLRIIDALDHCRPNAIGVENVVGFEGSLAHQTLVRQLQGCGYSIRSLEICPSQLGWPNRRPRFYLLGSQQPLGDWQPLPNYSLRLDALLDPSLSPEAEATVELLLSEEDLVRYRDALDRIEGCDGESVTACFAGSYGKTLLRAGSYLRCGAAYRRFSPNEVARLLGFPEQFRLQGLEPRSAWKLLGNSLSLPVVRYVLSHVPSLAVHAGGT